MGRPKLALLLGGRTVLERVLDAFRLAHIEKTLVVLAPHNEALQTPALAAGAEVSLLPEATPDMRATIEKGLTWLEQNCRPEDQDGWLLAPADHPLLEPAVIDALVQVWRDTQATLLIPTYGGKRGHPALIGWNHVRSIRALPADQGLNSYLRQHAAETVEVPVASADILCDLDTPEDYERLVQRWKSSER
jgi:molybdenum cofactor cytidylyltransferase